MKQPNEKWTLPNGERVLLNKNDSDNVRKMQKNISTALKTSHTNDTIYRELESKINCARTSNGVIDAVKSFNKKYFNNDKKLLNVVLEKFDVTNNFNISSMAMVDVYRRKAGIL